LALAEPSASHERCYRSAFFGINEFCLAFEFDVSSSRANTLLNANNKKHFIIPAWRARLTQQPSLGDIRRPNATIGTMGSLLGHALGGLPLNLAAQT
jgi:hypothetical protein